MSLTMWRRCRARVIILRALVSSCADGRCFFAAKGTTDLHTGVTLQSAHPEIHAQLLAWVTREPQVRNIPFDAQDWKAVQGQQTPQRVLSTKNAVLKLPLHHNAKQRELTLHIGSLQCALDKPTLPDKLSLAVRESFHIMDIGEEPPRNGWV